MIRTIPGGLKAASVLIAALALWLEPTEATQLDYKDSERIASQVWSIEFTMQSMGEESFSVRLPFPDYTYVGKWATYSTNSISVGAVGECGPILYELYHYNDGYSNQGVWLKLTFPCSENRVSLTVTQSVKLDLPGIDYPLNFFTNNPWMAGSEIVDVHSPIVENVLAEALALPGDWHERGWRAVPEKIVNWMNLNMTWSGSYETRYPKTASQVLASREGHCEEWAHAACALLLRAGIPAKVVMAGILPTHNSTPIHFDSANWHLSTAYWDGFGWILIDPLFSSGFSIPNRVVLGADQDSRNLKLRTNPDYLMDYLTNVVFDYQVGNYSGLLILWDSRCFHYTHEILEHYEIAAGPAPLGFEPTNNIIPNVPAEAVYVPPDASELQFSNRPNPFNPVTTFSVTLNRPGKVSIDLFSVSGRHLADIFDGYCQTGKREIHWNCSEMPSGVYFARIQTPSHMKAIKVVVLR